LRFDGAVFLFEFLPAVLTFYFVARAADGLPGRLSAWAARAAVWLLAAASVYVILQGRAAPWLLLTPASALVPGALLGRLSGDQRALRATLAAVGVLIPMAVVAWTRSTLPGRVFAVSGAAVLACHAIAYIVDVWRGRAAADRVDTAALYLLQFPVLPAGPLVRIRDFSANVARLPQAVGLGAFTYGARRVVLGVIKIVLVAGTLARPIDAIIVLSPARLRGDIAWLAAICIPLELYFLLSGYADLSIGIGRMFGFRYPENFRRPYLADSIREFWRSWSITSIAWLRDYLELPIAGRDLPTPTLFVNIVVGFGLLGLFHGGGWTVPGWALYSGAWLALEAIGLGRVIARLPRPLRHVYVLTVVGLGWIVLRAESAAQLWTLLQAMSGAYGWSGATFARYTTWDVWFALVTAFIGAGPLVPWISRWRVTVDASTTALLMMLAAVTVYWWNTPGRWLRAARAMWGSGGPPLRGIGL
jgi:alginate O-acetyltransferase complex protein AlgI